VSLLDFLIVYLIELIVRLGRTVVSSNWNFVTATIAGSQFRENWVWDCPTVDIDTYQVYGQTYGGTDKRSFFFSIFAEQEAERFSAGKQLLEWIRTSRKDQY
jgi:hypothetical protein